MLEEEGRSERASLDPAALDTACDDDEPSLDNCRVEVEKGLLTALILGIDGPAEQFCAAKSRIGGMSMDVELLEVADWVAALGQVALTAARLDGMDMPG